MSLKAFHIVFVSACVLVSALCAAIGFYQYAAAPSLANLAVGVISSVVGLGLMVYGKLALNKMKKISYL